VKENKQCPQRTPHQRSQQPSAQVAESFKIVKESLIPFWFFVGLWTLQIPRSLNFGSKGRSNLPFIYKNNKKIAPPLSFKRVVVDFNRLLPLPIDPCYRGLGDLLQPLQVRLHHRHHLRQCLIRAWWACGSGFRKWLDLRARSQM